MSEQATKTCIWCKQDCSNKPRQKDLKGNYLCKECVEPYQKALTARAKQRRPEKTPTTPTASDSAVGTREVLGGLIDIAIDTSGEACPSCSRMLAAEAVICIHCGYNKQTGRQIKSHISVEKGAKGSGSRKKDRKKGGSKKG